MANESDRESLTDSTSVQESRDTPQEQVSSWIASRRFIKANGGVLSVILVVIGMVSILLTVTIALFNSLSASQSSGFGNVNAQFTKVEERFTSIGNDVNSVRTDVNAVRTEVNAVRTDVNAVRTDVNALRSEMRQEFNSVRSDIREVRQGFQDLQNQVHDLEMEVARESNHDDGEQIAITNRH